MMRQLGKVHQSRLMYSPFVRGSTAAAAKVAGPDTAGPNPMGPKPAGSDTARPAPAEPATDPAGPR
jgi:hypothetical protein